MDWDTVVGFFSKTTPGTPALYMILASMWAFFWKGLPPVIAAWDSRLAKATERTDTEFKRFERLLAESDGRHDDCRKEVKALRDELNEVYGQLRQLRQMMASQFNVANTPPSMIASLAALDRLTGN